MSIVAAVQKKDIKTLSSYVSESYKDAFEQGRNGILGSFVDKFDRYEKIELTVSNVEITLGPGQKTADVKFNLLVKTKRAGGEPDQTPAWVQLKMAEEDGIWAATWANGDDIKEVSAAASPAAVTPTGEPKAVPSVPAAAPVQ